jgi:hypothetical protein
MDMSTEEMSTDQEMSSDDEMSAEMVNTPMMRR